MGRILGMTTNRTKTPKVLFLFLTLFALTAALAWGQTNTGGFAGTPEEDLITDTPKGSSVFLLDPSRFKIGHTISTSYASIGGRGILT
ncbi:MAG TPA: hypothetical protein VI546_04975, partial [candidate division Zixibacteria bacterium]|nr:hypothetical protein [candidate division Zixibacteria bacterium]